jgi:hypothetical protein
MTGTGMSIVTQNNIDSYNTAVNNINRNQKKNIVEVEKKLSTLKNTTSNFLVSIQSLQKSLDSLKKQIFLNQCMIDNWNVANPPYIYQIDILA